MLRGLRLRKQQQNVCKLVIFCAAEQQGRALCMGSSTRLDVSVSPVTQHATSATHAQTHTHTHTHNTPVGIVALICSNKRHTLSSAS